MARPPHAQQHTARVALIGELADRAAITDLFSRLGAYIDEHSFADLRLLFAPDAEISTSGGTAIGASAIVDQVAADHVMYARMLHTASNVLIEFEYDDEPEQEQGAATRARVRLNMEARFGHAASPEPVHARGGVCRATVERGPDGWRFTSLAITPTWAVGTAHVVDHGAAHAVDPADAHAAVA
jgi:hypothetical protein